MLKIKIGRTTEQKKDRAVESAVIGFIETKKAIDILNETLKNHKEVIVTNAKTILSDDDTSTISFGVDDDFVKVSFGFDVKIKDKEKLELLLEDRFDDLVTTETIYKPADKLKKMALEDDGLKLCLTVTEKTPTVAVVK